MYDNWLFVEMRSVMLSVFSFLALSHVAQAGDWPDVSAGLPDTSVSQNDAAVIVAIEDYVHLPDIPGAVQNGQDWRRYLVSRGIALANVHLIADADASRETVLDEATWATERVGEGGTVWFIYIGHGAPAMDGTDGLLVGADAQGTARSLDARSVRRTEVLASLAFGAHHEVVAVLDACFSGRAADSTSIAPGLQPVIPLALSTTTSATVLSAGATNQFAGPLPGLGRPAFSYLALGALRGWGDENGDGDITATEVARYAEGALATLVTDRRQVPEVTGQNPDMVVGVGIERGPDLIEIADSMAHRDPVHPVVGSNSGDSSVDVSGLEARIRERECQVVADRVAVEHRDQLLRQEALRVDSELASEWAALRTLSDRCRESADEPLLVECRANLVAFSERVAALEVSAAASELAATTACGARSGVADAVTWPVAESTRDGVLAYLSSYAAQHRDPPSPVSRAMTVGEGRIDGEGSVAQGVQRVVDQNSGQFTFCYEQQLRIDPSIAGEIKVEWYVRDRRVTSANVFSDTTGSAALGECVIGKIRRWRFDGYFEGEVLFPFIFN